MEEEWTTVENQKRQAQLKAQCQLRVIIIVAEGRRYFTEKDDAIIYKLLKIEFAIMWYRGKQMIYQYNHKEISEMQRRSAEGCK